MTMILMVALAVAVATLFVWLLWPTKAERAVPEYWTQGNGALHKAGFDGYKIELGPEFGTGYFWESDPEHPDFSSSATPAMRVEETVIFLVGFGHQPGHGPNIKRATRQSDKVIIIARNGVMGDRPRHIGRVSLDQMRRELIAYIRKLHESGRIKGRLVLFGHSLGATFEVELAAEFPQIVGNIILMGPPPMQWGGIARHLTYWKYAVFALPSAVRALLWGHGMLPSRWVARGLFTNGSLTDEEFEMFYGGLVPDSAWAFVQLMLFYDGTGAYKRARDAGWKGQVFIVAAEGDKICRLGMLEKMAVLIGATLFKIPGVPHCFLVKQLNDNVCSVLDKVRG